MADERIEALKYTKENRDLFLSSLSDWLRIPSISTSPENKEDMLRAAEWIATRLKALGLDCVTIFPTSVHPIVFAEYCSKKPNAPTMLVYGHYDVQPPDPLELWDSEPFDPTIRGENLHARGSSDMKGQVMAVVNALEAVLSQGPIPVNIKFLIEGEEEIGSPSLATFMQEHTDILKADFCLNTDTGMISPSVPTITYGLRGLAYYEIRVYGPDHDLHSGLFGGVVHNPAIVLCDLISGMHDENGRITLSGFYDRVIPLEDQERKDLSRLPLNDQTYLEQTGAPQLWGEAGYTTVERVGARPTLDVNGMSSGFTGKGSKTVIPSWAMAKISMRLVPDQDPEEVTKQLQAYLEEHAPATVRWELIPMSGGRASISDRNLPAIQKLTKAMHSVWGVEALFRREGGSVPVTGDMQKILKMESVLTGFGLPDDRIHSPNEKLHLPTWYRGIDTIVHFFYNLSEAN